MASSNETVSMALFCDFENVALGVRDAKYDKFDIKLVLERLLLKGSIVVKKAYCDWDRYKSFKGAMHEANFELIEIPHVRQSGKNSADIRLVVDALDLCYTKSHVNTFVIISGDSDFSPLVSKLRENAKQVIGVGVQQSTSDLLIANCDEFFFYDDLVRESQRSVAKREAARAQPSAQQASKKAADEDKSRNKEDLEKRRTKAVEIAVQTFDALASERGDSGKIWASVLKNAIKRRKPDFNETYYGFRAFGNLLEEAQARGLLEFGRDEKSGAYVYRSVVGSIGGDAVSEPLEAEAVERAQESQPTETAAEPGGKHESRRKGRGKRNAGRGQQQAAHDTTWDAADDSAHEAGYGAAGHASHDAEDAARGADEHADEVQAREDVAREPAAWVDERVAERSGATRHAADETGVESFGEAAVGSADQPANTSVNESAAESAAESESATEPAAAAGEHVASAASDQPERRNTRAPRKTAAKRVRKSKPTTPDDAAIAAPAQTPELVEPTEESAAKPQKPARKAAPRSRRPRKAPAGDAQ